MLEIRALENILHIRGKKSKQSSLPVIANSYNVYQAVHPVEKVNTDTTSG